MRAGRIITAVAVGLTAIGVGPLARPAGAAVVTGSSGGNTVVVNATGNETITPGCNGSGKVAINNVQVSPAVDCSALIQLTVTGDGGNQGLYPGALDGSSFVAHPKVVASLGDGADVFQETANNDNVDMGPGDDTVTLFYGGAANTGIELGAGTNDFVYFTASGLDDTITATSVNAFATVAQSDPDGGGSTTFAHGERLTVQALAGDDTIVTTAVTAASSLTFLVLDGGAGDDTISDGALSAALYGGAGTNTLTGGAGTDSYWSESQTDVVNGSGDGAPEYVYDTDGPRSGGRTLSGFTNLDGYTVQAHQGDVVMRIRPGTAGSTLFTTSLTRTGQQVVPAAFGKVTLGQSYVGALPHRGLADVVAGPDAAEITLPSTGGGLLDVTIPTGAWETDVAGQNVSIASGYATITASYVPDADHLSVHSPWTDENEGYAHRLYRDLDFRFLSNAQRAQVGDQITSGAKSRAAVAQGIINSDEYRGLDVDRVFLKYLRRVSDPGGRTYWINSLRNGKALWRFRAQLFGSNEYFTKAGATNASYVEKAYTDVLGRTPDPSGKAYWTNKLDNGADRGSVALQFINSPEARRRLVDDQFLRFIDRLPTAEEQANWVAALPSANGEQAMIAALVSGATYYNRS
ncbi:MAG: hypothetical protein JWO77_64 [Ilumatobacteraceae bacterium]|nr:hypothetical protein [Ilumatobacteraceae bacterium]